MAEAIPQLITQLLAEFTALQKRVAALETDNARQRATLVELQRALEEHALGEAELQQELAERDAAQQALEAERLQYQTLFTLAPDGYVVTDTLGVIHEANPAAARLLGMPAAHLHGKPLVGFVAREDAPRWHTLLQALQAPAAPAPAWIGWFRPPRRPPFLGELTVALRQEGAPQRTWYHWLLRDITARVEMEGALRDARAAQQRLEREARRAEHFALLGRLAAGISHEIRNPLGAVVLHVDLLEEELQQPSPDSSADVHDTLAEIKTNLARVDDLVQDYLSLVRVAALERSPCDLAGCPRINVCDPYEPR
jgi:PAS domain S-box-containing protein